MIRPFVCALALVALPATAQTAKPTPSGIDLEFQRSDLNHDGYLSRAELEARMAHMRAGTADVDPTHAKRLADLFIARADGDKDGRVSAAEARALLATVFTAYDLNHNGRIDPGEAAAARAAAQARRAPGPMPKPATTPR